MDAATRNFWIGATWFVGLVVIACCLIWVNRYLQFDHVHDHSHPKHEHSLEHPHEHKLPEHLHKLPDHEHMSTSCGKLSNVR